MKRKIKPTDFNEAVLKVKAYKRMLIAGETLDQAIDAIKLESNKG